MPIIGTVERRSFRVKLLNVCIHVLLITGAATMVYPLLLMISGSFKSSVDFTDFRIVPQFLSEDAELFRKHVTTKFNHNAARMSSTFKEPNATVQNLMPPDTVSEARVRDFRRFLDQCRARGPHYRYCVGMAYEFGVDALTLRKFRSWLQRTPEIAGPGPEGLNKLNGLFETEYQAWNEISLPGETFFGRRAVTVYDTPYLRVFLQFKTSPEVTPLEIFWPDLEGEFIGHLRRITRDLRELNTALHTSYNSWGDVTIPARVPADNPRLAAQWTEFVKNEVNPAFLHLDAEQGNPAWRAYLMEKYVSLEEMNKMLGTEWQDPSEIFLPETLPPDGLLRTDWLDFLAGNTTRSNHWIPFLKGRYKDVRALNAAWGSAYKSFSEILAPEEIQLPNPDSAGLERLEADRLALADAVAGKKIRELPPSALRIETLANTYRDWLADEFGGDMARLNAAYGVTGIADFREIRFPETAPGETNLALSDDWTQFVSMLPPEEIGLTRQAAMPYKALVREFYQNNSGVCEYPALSRDYRRAVRNENEIPSFLAFPSDVKRYTDKARTDYTAVIRSGKLRSWYRVPDAAKQDAAFQSFLREKYGTVEHLNRAWRTKPESFDEISLPSKEYEWHMMRQHRPFLIREYLKRNYLMVFDTLFVNGNAALNTVIYCFLAVLAALLVNPLCAYALSRYKPASSYKILLFLMLPMAFPAMVLGIPQFLLIKELGILNTFAALILPSMANGYSIFLLKGFFDSLPKELFESAAIDGASEWCVFWNIAMRLSTPILSVIALGAFTAAYANFMFAFLICQKESMWTMMVYLYQLQQRTSSAVGFAALIIAAVPTLLVFVFCQNIIIKGIVVPTEK